MRKIRLSLFEVSRQVIYETRSSLRFPIPEKGNQGMDTDKKLAVQPKSASVGLAGAHLRSIIDQNFFLAEQVKILGTKQPNLTGRLFP